MSERELERGGRQRNLVAGADALDLRDPLQDLWSGGRIVVHRARRGAGGENPGIVAAADDDADAAFGAARELALEHFLLEQCVAHRQKEEIDVEEVEEARNAAHGVEARPDPADHPGLAQFRKRPPPACLEVDEIGVERSRIVIPGVEVVNEQDVDPVDPEPLEAVLERAHDAVVAVVEHGLELEPAQPLVLDGVRPQRPAQDAADLGRYDVVAARLAIERPAERVLGKPSSVPWRGVEIAHAAVPRGADQSAGLIVVNAIEQFAERRGAKAKLGHAHVRPAELARL